MNTLKFLLLICLTTIYYVSSAQTQKNDLALTLGVSTNPAVENHRIAFDMSMRYYISDLFSVGGNFYTFSPKYSHGFGFDTSRTLINMYGINIPLQYEVVNMKAMSFSVGFSQGVLINVLRDRNQTTPQEFWDSDTGVGTSWEVPLKLATDTYFTVAPFVEISNKILEVDPSKNFSLYLTTRAAYQNAFGGGNFSKAHNFRNYILSLGLTLKGTNL